jgi:hypothetical protein
VWLFRRRALALATLFAFFSAPLVGWSVTVHLLADEHGECAAPESAESVALEIALHGHTHLEGTPPHGPSVRQ